MLKSLHCFHRQLAVTEHSCGLVIVGVIKRFTGQPNGHCFRFFLGSGTTAKMAVLTDRHYIGFELSSEYFDIACQRLDDAENEKFFDQEVKEAEQ